MVTARRLVGQRVPGRRAALAEVAPRRRIGQTAPRLVAEVVRRDLALDGGQLERVPIGTEVEHNDLAGLVASSAWSDPAAVRECPPRPASMDGELAVPPRAGGLVLL